MRYVRSIRVQTKRRGGGMKLPIKKEWFDKIKAGDKLVEYRDAHITFVCEETGETLVKRVHGCNLRRKRYLPEDVLESGVIEDDDVMCFYLGPKGNGGES